MAPRAVVESPATGAGAQSTSTAAEAVKYLGAPPATTGAPKARTQLLLAILPHRRREKTLLLPLWPTDCLGTSYTQKRLHVWQRGVRGGGNPRPVACGGPGGRSRGGGNCRAPSPAGASSVGPPRDEADWLRVVPVAEDRVRRDRPLRLASARQPAATATVLRPTPEDYEAHLPVERAHGRSRDGGGGSGDGRDRRGGGVGGVHDHRGGGEDCDRRAGGSWGDNGGGPGHSGGDGDNGCRTGTTRRGKGGGDSRYSEGNSGRQHSARRADSSALGAPSDRSEGEDIGTLPLGAR